MIRPPARSVTRFFVPLIDVLILLFCIFLLMPFVSGPTPEKPSDVELQRVRAQLRQAQRQLAENRNNPQNPFGQFAIQVLEMDATSGKLFARNGPGDRREIRNQADAQRLIDAEQRRAGPRKVGILVLYPQELSGFPLRSQVEAYRSWLATVPHAFEHFVESAGS